MSERKNSTYVTMTQAELDAGAGDNLTADRIVIVDANNTPTGSVYDSGAAGESPAIAVTEANINAALQSAGGAGWEKAQATAANYAITRPTSGASLDLHIETGGTLAAMLVANWPIPAAGVDQLRIRNMSAAAQTFSASGYSGLLTADGNVATSGTYSIPVDMAVHITIDEDGWIQVAPMGQEVSQAEMDAALLLKMNAVVTVAGATNLNTLVAEGFYQSDLQSDATNHPPHINEGTEGVLRWRVRVIRTSPGHCLQMYESTRNSQPPELFRRYSNNADAGSPPWSGWVPLDLALGTANPLAPGTAAPGVSLAASHEDHVHPIDTSRAAAASLTDGSIQALFDTLRADSVHFLATATDLDGLQATGWFNVQNPAGGSLAAGWYYIYNGNHRNTATGAPTTNYAFQLARLLTGAGNLMTRLNASGTWSAWTSLANTADVPALSSTAPVMDGTAAVGTGTTSARADHVHASDTSRAPVASPTFTGTPAAPTATAGTNTTQLASTAFVKTAVDTAVVGLLDYRGAFTPAVSSGAAGYPTTGGSGTAGAILKGDVFVASAAGFILTEAIQSGDSVLAKIDTPGQTAANWDKLNANISYVPEDQASKVTAFGTPTDTQYPSAKLVKDQLDLKSGTSHTHAPDATKQDVLSSGNNIKTINGESIVGPGNMVITSAASLPGSTATTLTDEGLASGNATVDRTTVAGQTILKYTTTGASTFKVPLNVTAVQVLAVAGGGGGGSGVGGDLRGGGGGAGGLLSDAAFVVTPGALLAVTVGAGGAAATTGSDSVFDTLTADGGGRGGSGPQTGFAGGSGGGGGANSGGANSYTGGTGVVGEGSDGGTGGSDGTSYRNGGGGGGASAVGAAGSANGTGGAGTASTITGASVTYAGGGGGGGPVAANGGAGGGGRGGAYSAGTATAGSQNTGGGGGGGANTVAGAAGGSGVVIIRFATQTRTYQTLTSYADNAAAKTGGLLIGEFYKKTSDGSVQQVT